MVKKGCKICANHQDMPSSQNFPYYWDMTKGRKGERPNVDYTDYAEGIWVVIAISRPAMWRSHTPSAMA